ncbi:MAG TPA: Crp/Fnr family transcriptional regulator [Steroidobacteraceae bacterium]|jgi:CRP-like cAMP-binding protein|nr:Crp/Fnr family transcriptional regulator [Steroidobacteraceae bacterium]
MTIEDDIGFFERVPTLSLLGRQALRILAIGAETRYIHGGEVLFNAGDEADGGFVIQEGRFSLASSEDAGTITVGPFTLLGEVALFTETQRPATATALEPSTVLLIPRELFIKMLDSFPDAARKLREILAKRLDISAREIDNVRAVLDAHERE